MTVFADDGNQPVKSKGVSFIRVKAKLIRHNAPNTPIGMQEHIPLGTIYTILPESIREMVWLDEGDLRKQFALKSVFVEATATGHAGWMPLEIFEIVPDA